MHEENGSSFESPAKFPTPEQEQVLGEVVYDTLAGQISEDEIRARMARAGFKQHHADDVITAVEWIEEDPSLSSMDDAMHWRPE
ncbi:hypothetical protein [Streptomyces tailanensis]|uniref:hypothetical protein n=1 Tax=Streptomyces tailanensis TaxID=2569858 RepID=UPI00122DCA39|nr:hypothetical protein [Streptomyces tailanensis]